MANYTINNLSALTSPSTSDYVPVWNVAGATTRKVTITNLFAAVLDNANTWTAGQVILPTLTSQIGLNINMPTGASQQALRISDNGTSRAFFQFVSGSNRLYIYDADLGAGAAGHNVRIGRNSNASNGAGFLQLVARGSTEYRVWPDNSGNLRIHTADPTNANDTAGTVVGTQTSSLDAKNVVGIPVGKRDALRNIVEAAEAIRRFTYKNGSFGGEEFSGIIVDYAPRYGMDKDAKHPAGRSLNVINAIGDLFLAVAALAEGGL